MRRKSRVKLELAHAGNVCVYVMHVNGDLLIAWSFELGFEKIRACVDVLKIDSLV